MKFVEPNQFADPDAAARKLVEIAKAVEAVRDNRVCIELNNRPFLDQGPHPGPAPRCARARDLAGPAVTALIRDLREIPPTVAEPFA